MTWTRNRRLARPLVGLIPATLAKRPNSDTYPMYGPVRKAASPSSSSPTE
jgi:hypothetical protein